MRAGGDRRKEQAKSGQGAEEKKEEAAKKKAEERARKAEEAAKKRENKIKKRTMQVPCRYWYQAKKRKTTSESVAATGTWTTTDPSSSIDPGASTSSRYSSCLSAAATAAATPSGTSENDRNANINSDVCCVCYLTFENDQQQGNGLEWVQCVCGRWLHEECICEIDIDEQGRELFCPFCAV